MTFYGLVLAKVAERRIPEGLATDHDWEFNDRSRTSNERCHFTF